MGVAPRPRPPPAPRHVARGGVVGGTRGHQRHVARDQGRGHAHLLARGRGAAGRRLLLLRGLGSSPHEVRAAGAGLETRGVAAAAPVLSVQHQLELTLELTLELLTLELTIDADLGREQDWAQRPGRWWRLAVTSAQSTSATSSPRTEASTSSSSRQGNMETGQSRDPLASAAKFTLYSLINAAQNCVDQQNLKYLFWHNILAHHR